MKISAHLAKLSLPRRAIQRIGNFTGATLTIINSTISSKEALNHGGGLGNRSGFVTITSSTIANNVAEESGGLEEIGSDFAGP